MSPWLTLLRCFAAYVFLQECRWQMPVPMVVSGLAICLNEVGVFLLMSSCGRVSLSPGQIVMDICILYYYLLWILNTHIQAGISQIGKSPSWTEGQKVISNYIRGSSQVWKGIIISSALRHPCTMRHHSTIQHHHPHIMLLNHSYPNPSNAKSNPGHVSYSSMQHAILRQATGPSSYRQLSITPPTRQNLQPTLDIRPHNRNITRKLTNRHEEVAKQNEQSV